MNNTDFRRFVLDTPRRQDETPSAASKSTSLGSKGRANMPMTPRTVRGGPTNDFARQLAEQNDPQQGQRKFRAMAAPKGTRLASGYRDRAHDRENEGGGDNNNGDDREARIKALEEQMKLGQIEPGVFLQLRDSITGGDISATHLVKGLDRQLLQRIKRGEDVLNTKDETPPEGVPSDEQTTNADEELDRLEEQEVAPTERKEKIIKKGIMAPPPPPPRPAQVAGTKRSRNDILAELKASRAAAKEAAQPALSSKFKKVGPSAKPSPKIEIDARGREVLITVDAQGNVKRKVRRAVQDDLTKALLMPDKALKPLGMTVPEITTPAANTIVDEEVDDDIFEGVGNAYDPLGDLEETSSSSDSDTDDHNPKHSKSESTRDHHAAAAHPSDTPPPPQPSTSPAPPTNKNTSTSTTTLPKRNYFNTPTAPSPPPKDPASHLITDPTFLATLHKAAAIASRAEETSHASDHNRTSDVAAKPTIAQRLLARQDRDFEDMDMGFGESRFGDDAEEGDGEEGGKKVRLSTWKGLEGGGDDGEDDEGVGSGKGKGRGKGNGSGRGNGGGHGEKQQKGKKKGRGGGGDKNNAADVLRVIEGRKAK